MRTSSMFRAACLILMPWIAACQQANPHSPSRAVVVARQLTDAGAEVQLFTVTIDPFSHVDLTNAQHPDQLLPLLVELPPVHQLYARDPRIGDAELGDIIRLSELRTLDLEHSSVTDAGMEQIAKLDSLANVFLPADISATAKDRLKLARPGLEIRDHLGLWPRVPDDPSDNTPPMSVIEAE